MFALRLLTRTIKQRSAVGYFQAFTRHNSKVANEEVLRRYKNKLEQKAGTLGLKNIDELQEKLKDEIEEKKKELNKMDPLKELEEFEKKQEQEAHDDKDSRTIKVRSPIAKDTPKLPYKHLNSYVDAEKLKDLPKKEIEYIWRARFQNDDHNMHASMSTLQFATIYANAFKNKSFILPLPKNEDGYEMHFVQWSFVGPHTTHCMITTVAEYKLHKEYAKPHTTLMFHQELAESKDIVLMNGYVEKEAALKLDEAQLLVLNIQRFYGELGDSEKSKKKLKLLQDFTTGNPEFKMEDLIAEATSFE